MYPPEVVSVSFTKAGRLVCAIDNKGQRRIKKHIFFMTINYGNKDNELLNSNKDVCNRSLFVSYFNVSLSIDTGVLTFFTNAKMLTASKVPKMSITFFTPSDAMASTIPAIEL